ncbi:MAG: thiamine-phosphate kinase [Desulfurococcaceae archaeon]
MKLSDFTEDIIVDKIAKTLVEKPSWGEHLFYPEDARDVIPRGPRIIYSIDAYTVRSLRLPWRSYADVGWSALVGALSDVVSKGGIPHACLIALGLNRDMSLEELEDLLKGFREAADYYGVRILGGDTNESFEAWIAVSVLGFTTARIPPSRGGLKPGDVIIATGVYGATGFIAKHGVEKAKDVNWVVEKTRRPRIHVEVAHVVENFYKAITASMDVSDGLGYTLLTMSRLSRSGIHLKQPPRVYSELYELCQGDDLCTLNYALDGGEEYGVVLGVKRDSVQAVVNELEYFEIPYSVIGEAVETTPGIYFNGKALNVVRYDQFHGWRPSS